MADELDDVINEVNAAYTRALALFPSTDVSTLRMLRELRQRVQRLETRSNALLNAIKNNATYAALRTAVQDVPPL